MKSYVVTVAPSQTPSFTLYFVASRRVAIGDPDLLVALPPTRAIHRLLDTPLICVLVAPISVVDAAYIYIPLSTRSRDCLNVTASSVSNALGQFKHIAYSESIHSKSNRANLAYRQQSWRRVAQVSDNAAANVGHAVTMAVLRSKPIRVCRLQSVC